MIEKTYLRLPKDWKFEAGKSYKVSYRRTEWRFVWDPKIDLYKREKYTVGNFKFFDYVIAKDVPGHIDYILADANGKGIIQIINNIS